MENPAFAESGFLYKRFWNFLSAGDSHEDSMYQYPSLEEKDIEACLLFAAKIAGLHYHIHPIQQHA